jgi:hypothetical protein
MPPCAVAIEKKSTGVTLLSVLKNIRGLRILDIERTKSTGNKTERFLSIQQIIASQQISLPRNAKHTSFVLEHMRKITANDSHRRDDVCFVAGTKIATLFGYKNIEDIKINDFIITPFGIKKVLDSKSTGEKPIIKKFNLSGTSSHPIFYKDRFERLDIVCDANNLDYLSFKGLLTWKLKRLLSSMALNIDLWDRKDIILANQLPMLEKGMRRACMLQFGNFITSKKFLKAMSFIIKITIISIMTFLIWNVFLVSNIFRCMLKKEKIDQQQKKNWSIWKKLGFKLHNGIKALKVVSGIVKMLKNVHQKYFMKENVYALNVGKSSLQKETQKDAVLIVKKEYIEEILPTSKPIVFSAEKDSLPEINIQKREIERHVPEYVREEQQVVYNITVKDCGVYYANDILVSNCDTLYDGVKLGIIDNVIMNFTPNKVNLDTEKSKVIMGTFQKILELRNKRYYK